MMIRRPLVATVPFALLVALAGCQAGGARSMRPPTQSEIARDLQMLATWMSGEFSSAAQHAGDPDNYAEIHLKTVPIWPQRPDGPWLYVEQAAAGSLDRPYRQRVYHLVAESNAAFHSIVYELPGDPLDYAGAWAEPSRFDALSPADLIERTGCTMHLRHLDEKLFAGSTMGTDCKSDLRGAAYAESNARITPTRIVSWDRGFDAEGNQVWGATQGGYVFEKIRPLP